MDTVSWSRLRDLIQQTTNTTGIDMSAVSSLIQESLRINFTDINSNNNNTTMTDVLPLDREIELLESILDGRALMNHLEPSYYSALEKIINELFTVT